MSGDRQDELSVEEIAYRFGISQDDVLQWLGSVRHKLEDEPRRRTEHQPIRWTVSVSRMVEWHPENAHEIPQAMDRLGSILDASIIASGLKEVQVNAEQERPVVPAPLEYDLSGTLALLRKYQRAEHLEQAIEGFAHAEGQAISRWWINLNGAFFGDEQALEPFLDGLEDYADNAGLTYIGSQADPRPGAKNAVASHDLDFTGSASIHLADNDDFTGKEDLSENKLWAQQAHSWSREIRAIQRANHEDKDIAAVCSKLCLALSELTYRLDPPGPEINMGTFT